MSKYVDFHYMPLEGKITGEQVLKQTEDAINDLGNKVYSLDIDQSEIDEAIEKSNEAINTANSALSAVTTGRSVWFNNVAEMVAANIDAGVTAETKGYYVANDGGNALYLIRQEKSGDVVDGGSLIALDNGNMAELVTDGTVNVKQFGAIGNGTDDDTTVFQNTSSYAQSNGFVPFVGVATYKITSNVTGTFNSFGEVTITGGGTVDIINLHEVVSDVSDIRDEVVDETASAKAYSESAATSATNASNSASSASTTATQLMAYLADKETLTAPAIDPTLTISGAGADAKETGRVVRDLAYNNVFNFLEGLYGPGTDAGITYTINGDGSCTVNGTATGQSFKRIWDNGNTFPLGMYAGQTLYVDYTATNVSLQIWKRKNNQLSSLYYIFAPRAITIPADSEGIYIRLAVSSGVTVSNETVKPQCYTVDGEGLRGTLCNVGSMSNGLAAELGYTDANDIDRNCIIACFENHSLSNVPYEIGWLQTILNGADATDFRFQIMYPMFSTGQIMYRAFRFGTTWDDWKGLNEDCIKYFGRVIYSSCDDITENCVIFVSKADSVTPPSIPDFPLNQPGWLQTLTEYPTANWTFQIAYPWSTGGTVMFRSYNTSGWTSWRTIGDGQTINNTFVTNHYTNTYNVTATPTITADTNNYLASTGDTTDRAADIEAMLNSTGVCHLGAGDFYVSGVDIPQNATLDGCGNATKIRLLDSVTDGYAVKLNTQSTFKDVAIYGATSDITLSSTVGTRHGILWEGNAAATSGGSIIFRGTVSNVIIHHFTGGAITCTNTGYSTASGLNVDNVHITNCNAGINVAYWSEFNRFTNVNAVGNYYGCINNGGNNMFVNCNFSSNKLAMLMDNSQGQSPNNTHGSAVGCVFNHTDGNTGIGIKILNCNSGFIFDGCQIFFSQIYLESTDGIVVSNTNFGNVNCNITIVNGGAVLFNGNMHQAQPTITITNNTKVHFANCYVRSTGAEVTA